MSKAKAGKSLVDNVGMKHVAGVQIGNVQNQLMGGVRTMESKGHRGVKHSYGSWVT